VLKQVHEPTGISFVLGYTGRKVGETELTRGRPTSATHVAGLGDLEVEFSESPIVSTQGST